MKSSRAIGRLSSILSDSSSSQHGIRHNVCIILSRMQYSTVGIMTFTAKLCFAPDVTVSMPPSGRSGARGVVAVALLMPFALVL